MKELRDLTEAEKKEIVAYLWEHEDEVTAIPNMMKKYDCSGTTVGMVFVESM